MVSMNNLIPILKHEVNREVVFEKYAVYAIIIEGLRFPSKAEAEEKNCFPRRFIPLA